MENSASSIQRPEWRRWGEVLEWLPEKANTDTPETRSQLRPLVYVRKIIHIIVLYHPDVPSNCQGEADYKQEDKDHLHHHVHMVPQGRYLQIYRGLTHMIKGGREQQINSKRIK